MTAKEQSRLTVPGSVGRSRQLDASVLLAVASFLLVFRLPYATHVLGLLSVAVIVLQRKTARRRTNFAINIFGFWLAFLVLVSFPKFLTSPSLTSYFLLAVEALLLYWATIRTGSVENNCRKLFQGIYCALVTHLLVACFEIISNIKILSLRAPEASTARQIAENRFLVASLFVNYNDFSVAMALLVTILVAKICYSRSTPNWRLGLQFVGACIATLLILIIGSRGALVGMACSVGLTLIMVIRFRHPTVLRPRSIVLLIVLVVPLLAYVWKSSYFQDSSTSVRGTILKNSWGIIRSDFSSMLFGYGTPEAWKSVTFKIFPKNLMDPHNVLLEIIIGFGVLSLLLFLIAWMVAFYSSFIKNRLASSYVSVASAAILLVIPLLGVVPSSYLHYGHIFLFIVCYCASTMPAQTSPDKTAIGS